MRIEIHRRIARGLAQSGEVRAGHGRACRLRLEDRKAEAFREGRLNERYRADEKGRNVRVGHEAQRVNTLGVNAPGRAARLSSDIR